MTEAESLGVIFTLVETYNAIFNFWLTITFSFLVAFYFISGKLSNKLRAILICLYSAAAAIFAVRYFSIVASTGVMITRMNEAGYEYIPITFTGERLIIFGGTFLLILVGSVVAVAFSISYSRSTK